MGFPAAPDTVIADLAPVKTRRRKKVVVFNPDERGCEYCPLQATWPSIKTPQMKLHGRRDADILIMGEAPGREEDEHGRPFIGASGRLLKQVLPMREAERWAMTNAVRCRPAGNRDPVALELHACSQYLEADLASGQYKAILGLGNVPLHQFMDETSITAVHGLKFPVRVGNQVLWYFPTLHPAYVLRGGEDSRSPYMPILQNDLRHFFRRLDKWKPPVIEAVSVDQVICAYNEDEARGHLAKLQRSGKPVGFDLETNGLRPNTIGADIMTAAVSNGVTTVAWPVHHPQAPNDWGLNLLFEVTQRLRWIAHHAGFELAWLWEHARRRGLDWTPAAGFDDSMVAARLFQRREGCLNLGVLTRLYCGVNIKKLSDIDTAAVAATPLEQVLPYNGLDAWGSWRIFKLLSPQVDQNNYQSLMATIESVTEMQLAGLDIDQDAAKKLQVEWTQRADAALEHAKTIPEVLRFEADREKTFNLGSSMQVAEVLSQYGNVVLPMTAGSEKADAKIRYSTSETALTGVEHPLAIDVLEYRHSRKMLMTYVAPLLEAPARFVDAKIHPVYSTVLTKTLRLSCEDPNAQNFPKRKDQALRTPIVPPPGCIWASADYGQLEARVYGMASRDRALCDELINGEDIHAYWLSIILREYPPYFDRLVAKVTPNDTKAQVLKGGRDIIKSDFVFASFFGTSAKNVAERTSIPFDIATEVLGMFWDRYSKAHDWLKARRRDYYEAGLTQNLCGVERYGIMTGNECINTPIQSTGARLVLEAQNEMCREAKRLGDPHLMPRINIHDDLVFSVPDSDDLIIEYIQAISKVLVKVRFRWQIVPLKVEWKVGANWAELDYVYDYTGEYVR